MIAFVAVVLGATVSPTLAREENRGRDGGHAQGHEVGRGYHPSWRGDYYPPHRRYYAPQGGYYPPSPPVVLMPPPIFPGFNIVIPIGR